MPNAPHCCQAPPTEERRVSPPESFDDRDRCPRGCSCGWGEPDHCQCQRENVVAYAAAFIAVLWFLGWLFYGG